MSKIKVLLTINLVALQNIKNTIVFQKEIEIPIAPFPGLKIEDDTSSIKIEVREVICNSYESVCRCVCFEEIFENEKELEERAKKYNQEWQRL